MHYKILASDPDELMFPAKRDADGDVIYKQRADGETYWETHPAGIPLGGWYWQELLLLAV